MEAVVIMASLIQYVVLDKYNCKMVAVWIARPTMWHHPIGGVA